MYQQRLSIFFSFFFFFFFFLSFFLFFFFSLVVLLLQRAEAPHPDCLESAATHRRLDIDQQEETHGASGRRQWSASTFIHFKTRHSARAEREEGHAQEQQHSGRKALRRSRSLGWSFAARTQSCGPTAQASTSMLLFCSPSAASLAPCSRIRSIASRFLGSFS